MVRKDTTTKKKKKPELKAPANLIAGLAVIGLVILSIVDLINVNDVPNFIYFGLIGASLGAKFDEVSKFFGGRR